MKTLFIGGVKSGKSRLAEDYILQNTEEKPYYLATTVFIDEEMRQRITVHQQRRQDRFHVIEEPVKLLSAMQACHGPVLVECISIWLNNMLHHGVDEGTIFLELEAVLRLPNSSVFVLNEVGMGIIPDNALARRYVDISGKAAQMVANVCDEVFFCCAGLTFRLK